MENKLPKYKLAKIKVVGIGGAGNNAISRMFNHFPRFVDLIAINTDIQDLNYTQAKYKIHIGRNLTKGLGTGMNPDLGRQAAEENRSEIVEVLKGADMVFITAGEGGGTGSGAAPVVAEIAKELGILTVAIVTKPFSFEGSRRAQIAQEGILKIKDRVDTLITIPNDRIFSIIDKDTPLLKAFEEIDEILKNSVMGITELIMSPGIVNLDFADVRAIMSGAGSAIIGIGTANGPERAKKAVDLATNSPLLENSINGAKGVLLGIAGHRDLKMKEVDEIAGLISENVDQSAKIIFGAYYDRKLNKGQLKVTLIATGFNGGNSLKLFYSSDKSIMIDETKPSREKSLFLESLPEELNQDKKVDKKKLEEIWEIPTFLRKKRGKK